MEFYQNLLLKLGGGVILKLNPNHFKILFVGMLSSITQSRKEYLQENENLRGRLQQLNMNGEKPGPSHIREIEVPLQKSFLFNVDSNSKSIENEKINTLEYKEKEKDKFYDCLRILTMNSKFITSLKTGYSVPFNEPADSQSRVFRYARINKRRLRVYPYNKRPCLKVVEHSVNRNDDNLSELDQIACRLRTTSLSSGTCGKRRVALETCKKLEKSVGSMKRSRSMENLIGSKENPPLIFCDKAKDIETVSKGIQEMQVEDCT